MKKNHIAIIAAVICVAIVGFFAFGNGGNGGGKAQKVVIQNIRRIYDKNKVQVNADYLGKRIQITNEFAHVQFVRKGDRLSFNSTGAYNVADKDEYIVDLKYSYGVDQFLGGAREELVRCYFDKSQEKSLTQLVNGVDVTVVGVFDGEESPYLRIPFRLKNCKIVRVDRHITGKESTAILTEEANKGNVRAMFELGIEYIAPSVGTETHTEEGLKWLELSAENGSAVGQLFAGEIYSGMVSVINRTTINVPTNFAKGLKYYKMSADQGNSSAMQRIGYMYEKGIGVKQDTAEARNWYQKSVDAGNQYARDDLKRIEGK